MKINKVVSMDPELHAKLSKEPNASELISSLLHKHYGISYRSEEKIIEDVKAKMKEIQVKEISKKKKELESKKLRDTILKELEK